jgi:hypothetical protein
MDETKRAAILAALQNASADQDSKAATAQAAADAAAALSKALADIAAQVIAL